MRNINIKKILIITLPVVIAVGLFSGGYYSRGYYDKMQEKNASKVGGEFVQDVTEGKLDEAYALTSKSLRKNQDKDAFTKAMANLKSDKPTLQTPQVLHQGSNILYLQNVLGLPKSSTGVVGGTFYVALAHEGGGWKVTTVTVQ